MTLLSILAGMIGGSLVIALTWVVIAGVLIGLGLLLRRLWGLRELEGPDDWFGAFWAGLVLVLGILQLWHLVRPVDDIAAGLVGALGVAGLALHGGAIARSLRASASREHLPSALALAVLVLWCANRSMGSGVLYDSGMYHVPFVEWVKAHPIVPGLANLHGRFGFNPSSLLYVALLDRGPWTAASSHIANGPLVAALLVQLTLAARRFARVGAARDLFAVVLVSVVAMTVVRHDARTLSTDVTVSVLLLGAGLALARRALEPRASRDTRRDAWELAFVSLMLAGAVCVKLSAVVFAGSTFALALWLWRDDGALGVRRLAAAIALPAVVMATWLGRGVILSGYPLYPSRLFAASVPWRVPEEQALAEEAWVRMSARYLNTNKLGVGWHWIGGWLEDSVTRGDVFVDSALPILITIVAVLRIAVARGRGVPSSDHRVARLALLLAPIGIASLFWAVTAPHPRFGQSIFWLLAATSCTIAWLRAPVSADAAAMRRRLAIAPAALVIGLTALQIAKGLVASPESRNKYWVVENVVSLPTGDSWVPPFPTQAVAPYTTLSGLVVSVPTEGNGCWTSPVPCTPHPSPSLRLRRPGDLAGGFEAPGPWRALRFPNPWSRFLVLFRCQRERSTLSRAAHDEACLQRALREETLDARSHAASTTSQR